MKSKLFALMLMSVLVGSICLCACDEDPPSIEYRDMTNAEIITLYNDVTNYDNYLGKKGAKIKLDIAVSQDSRTITAALDAKIDARDNANVMLNADADITISAPKDASKGGGVAPMSVSSPIFEKKQVKYSVFVDKSVFYVSKTQNGNVEYDSEQLPSVGGTSGNVNSRDNVNLLINTALSYVDFNISEYTEYISGSCYDDDGHYIITVDYPGGEEQGVTVEAFVLKLDMISDGLTANSAKIEFRAQGVTVTGEFGIGDTEIQTFSDTEKAKYNGTLLDDFSEGVASDFYGKWIGGGCEVQISEKSASATVESKNGSVKFFSLGKYAVLGGDAGLYILHLTDEGMELSDGFKSYSLVKASE